MVRLDAPQMEVYRYLNDTRILQLIMLRSSRIRSKINALLTPPLFPHGPEFLFHATLQLIW